MKSQSIDFIEVEQKRLTLETLDDIDAGRIVEHQSVLDRVESVISNQIHTREQR